MARSTSSSSSSKRKAAPPPAPPAPASPSPSGSGSSHASDEDDDEGGDSDGLDELVDSEEDEFEEDRQNPARVAQWEDDEGEGDEGSEEESDLGEEEDDEAERPVGSRDAKGKGKAKADELARLQNDLRALPLSTLLRAQRALPAADHSDDDQSEGEDGQSASGSGSGSEAEEELSPEAAKAERVAEARRKLAELTRIKRGGAPETPIEEEKRKERERKVLQKRSDKHAPTEISSKRQVSRKRVVVEVEKVERRDPRFSNLSGSLDPHLHSKSYGFIPEMLSSELSSLQAQLKLARKAVLSASRSDRPQKETDLASIEAELGRVRTRREREARERREREAVSGWKKEERQKREEGKGEWHLKDAEKKRLLANAKHTALLEQGGQFAVKKSLDKKIRKQDGKEKKSRPWGLGFGGDAGGDRKRVKM